LIGSTAADCRDVMIEGPSGILACCAPWEKPTYEPSKRRVSWPNGAMAIAYSAEEPDRLRGPQHTHAWTDELCAWSSPEAWDQLMFGLRLGDHPRVVVTTTPRPTKLIRELAAAPTTKLTRGSTHENVRNLAPGFIEGILSKYANTRLEQQEVYGMILADFEGALFKREFFKYRTP
jgi:phage terminase large subunit-like protein